MRLELGEAGRESARLRKLDRLHESGLLHASPRPGAGADLFA
jgi:hypothetical protein